MHNQKTLVCAIALASTASVWAQEQSDIQNDTAVEEVLIIGQQNLTVIMPLLNPCWISNPHSPVS